MVRREPRPFATLGMVLLVAILVAGCASTQESVAPNTTANGSGNLSNSTNETPTSPFPGFNTTAGSGQTPVVGP